MKDKIIAIIFLLSCIGGVGYTVNKSFQNNKVTKAVIYTAPYLEKSTEKIELHLKYKYNLKNIKIINAENNLAFKTLPEVRLYSSNEVRKLYWNDIDFTW